MAFINKDGLQHLTNQLVRAENIKVASLRGSNIKEVIDNIQRECDNVANPNTMIIENDISTFKIGQGKNINVSGDIEKGITSFTFQGKTYQNLCKSNIQFYTSDEKLYDIEYTTESNKVTNLTGENASWTYWGNSSLKLDLLQPKTKYTIFLKASDNLNNKIYFDLKQGNALLPLSNAVVLTKKGNYLCGTIETFNTDKFTKAEQIIYLWSPLPNKQGQTTTIYSDMILLAGDLSNINEKEIPNFFEEIKSSFEDNMVSIEIKSPNLANIATDNYLESTKGNFSISNVEPGEYTLSLKRNDESIKYNLLLRVDGEYKDIEGAGGLSTNICSFTIKEKGILRMNAYTNNIDISDIMLVKGKYNSLSMPKFTPYYIKHKLIDIKEPLRSLPNGICDEVVNNNGQWQLIRRVGKTTLNGTESDWASVYAFSKTNVFRKLLIEAKNTITSYDVIPDNFIVDKLPIVKYSTYNVTSAQTTSFSSLFNKNTYNATVIYINKNSSKSLPEFKQWLSQNPITVYYELVTPVIIPIEPLEFSIEPLSTIYINSNIAPSSTHTVILNRSGQIEQGIELIARLKYKVEELEKQYDNQLLNTQLLINTSKLNLQLKGDK